MGELLLQLRKDNMKAMKEHDSLTKGVLSLVIAAITLAEKEAGHTLEKNDELAYIQREIKQTNETIESIPESREDLKEEAGITFFLFTKAVNRRRDSSDY